MKTRKYALYASLMMLLITSCVQTDKYAKTERVKIIPTILSEIETSFPGELIVVDNYLLWTSPFNSEKSIHVVDKSSGKELCSFLHKGQGPDEMMNPNLALMQNGDLLSYSMGRKEIFQLSIDSALQEKSYIVAKLPNPHPMSSRIIPVDSLENIYFDLTAPKPFIFVHSQTNASYSFGVFPFKDSITNKLSAYQGSIAYNASRKTLVYATFEIPYLATYTMKAGKFVLNKRFLANKSHRVINGKLHDEGSRRGATALALSKDYIITIERDRKYDQTNEASVGRDINKLPHTVFVYDYNLHPIKIINMGIPLIRIAANTASDTLFFIGANPEFVVGKINI
jgi:hypothetical protein